MSASIYSSKRSESSSREFVSRPHSSSHHFKGHINVRMEIGAQIAFRRRSSSDTLHSPPILGCNFIRLRISHHRKCFFAPEATKIQREGARGSCAELHVCASLSFANVYKVRPRSVRCEQQFAFNTPTTREQPAAAYCCI